MLHSAELLDEEACCQHRTAETLSSDASSDDSWLSEVGDHNQKTTIGCDIAEAAVWVRATTARLAAVNLHPEPGARTTDFVPAPWDVLAPGIPRPFQCQGPEYEDICLDSPFLPEFDVQIYSVPLSVKYEVSYLS
ncbi:Hypothetical predicted protein [Scomber scombrus]|uniref:Uncharacterized protein n=1 Tax=Scomber scombrus TaxID=13677 RepID=A0AAV1P7D4_SCOSC